MDRDAFTSLPLPIALGILYDIAHKSLEPIPKPAVPRAPLYDGRLSRGNKGFCWMSEMLLRDLEFWEKRNRESAEQGGEYAEKNSKTAATLLKWIEWRRLFPNDIWSGKRNDDRASAKPPSGDPELHQWDNSKRSNGGQRNAPKSEPPPPEDDFNF